MTNYFRFIVLAIFAMFVLSACSGTSTDTTGMFLKNAVAVRYQESTISGTNDSITFKFYKPGQYYISFEKMPGTYTKWAEYMPKDFPITITDVSKPYVISQKILPTNVRIKITSEGVTEYNDFQ